MKLPRDTPSWNLGSAREAGLGQRRVLRGASEGWPGEQVSLCCERARPGPGGPALGGVARHLAGWW